MVLFRRKKNDHVETYEENKEDKEMKKILPYHC